MVMQRIFQGRTEQELLSEQMVQARFASNRGRAAALRGGGTSLLDLVGGGAGAAATSKNVGAIEPGAPPGLGGVLGAALEADAASKADDDGDDTKR